MLGIIPVKISSGRLMLKNLMPVEGIPSFVHAALAMAPFVERVVVAVEHGGLPYVMAISSTYFDNTNIELLESTKESNGANSTVDDVVRDVIQKEGGNDFIVCYATQFNIVETDIRKLLSVRIDGMGMSVGYVDKDRKPIGISSFNSKQFEDGGHYPNGSVLIKADESLIDIDTREDFERAIELRAGK